MNFKNKPNILHETIEGKKIWESRSVAVNAVILLMFNNELYVLASKRGPNAADSKGLMNLPSGYLDWDESGTEAMFREIWEECGLDINILLNNSFYTFTDYIEQPWHVNTIPSENRQNVSLRYGLYADVDNLFDLTTEHNEIVGEVEDSLWLNIKDINKYKWAFNHDKVIEDFTIKIDYILL